MGVILGVRRTVLPRGFLCPALILYFQDATFTIKILVINITSLHGFLLFLSSMLFLFVVYFSLNFRS